MSESESDDSLPQASVPQVNPDSPDTGTFAGELRALLVAASLLGVTVLWLLSRAAHPKAAFFFHYYLSPIHGLMMVAGAILTALAVAIANHPGPVGGQLRVKLALGLALLFSATSAVALTCELGQLCKQGMAPSAQQMPGVPVYRTPSFVYRNPRSARLAEAVLAWRQQNPKPSASTSLPRVVTNAFGDRKVVSPWIRSGIVDGPALLRVTGFAVPSGLRATVGAAHLALGTLLLWFVVVIPGLIGALLCKCSPTSGPRFAGIAATTRWLAAFALILFPVLYLVF